MVYFRRERKRDEELPTVEYGLRARKADRSRAGNSTGSQLKRLIWTLASIVVLSSVSLVVYLLRIGPMVKLSYVESKPFVEDLRFKADTSVDKLMRKESLKLQDNVRITYLNVLLREPTNEEMLRVVERKWTIEELKQELGQSREFQKLNVREAGDEVEYAFMGVYGKEAARSLMVKATSLLDSNMKINCAELHAVVNLRSAAECALVAWMWRQARKEMVLPWFNDGMYPISLSVCSQWSRGTNGAQPRLGSSDLLGCLEDGMVFVCVPQSQGQREAGDCLGGEVGSRVCGGDLWMLCGNVGLDMLNVAGAVAFVRAVEGEGKGDAMDRAMTVKAEVLGALNRVQDDIKAAYMQVLDREPDKGGLTSYTMSLIRGALTLPKLYKAMRDSPEFKNSQSLEKSSKRARRALSQLRAINPACAADYKAFKENSFEMIMNSLGLGVGQLLGEGEGVQGMPPEDGKWCRGAVPYVVFHYLLCTFSNAATAVQILHAFPNEVPGVAQSLRDVESAFTSIYGRFPHQYDLQWYVPRLVHHDMAVETMQKEMMESDERKVAMEEANRSPDKSQRLPALKRFIHSVCDGGGCAEELGALGTDVQAIQIIWNRFGPLIHAGKPLKNFKWQQRDEFLPIAMYVYNRPAYLRRVLHALRKVRGIENVLLVVSMDGLFPAMFDLLREVDFCPVRVLLHPLPSVEIGKYGGRGADGVLVVKKHWMWLVEQVFVGLRETEGYLGDVLFLEEDHMPSPDIFMTAKALLAIKNSPDCEGCWGVYNKFGCMREDKETDMHKACRVKWFVNTGIAFNASIFHSIRKSDFNSFRDGWDWGIYHLIQTAQLLPCQPKCTPHMIAPAVSRISNIGTEGITVRQDNEESLAQLHFGTVGDDVFEKGYDPAKLHLSEYFDHGGPTDEPIYFGTEIGFLNQH